MQKVIEHAHVDAHEEKLNKSFPLFHDVQENVRLKVPVHHEKQYLFTGTSTCYVDVRQHLRTRKVSNTCIPPNNF